MRISADEVSDFCDTQIVSEEKEKKVYNILVDLNSPNNLVAGQKRKLENSSESSIEVHECELQVERCLK